MIISLITAIDFPSWLSENVFTIGGFSLKWYGLGYVVGLFGAYLYAVRMTKRRDIWISGRATRVPVVVPTETMLSDLMFYCLIGIIVGGRLGYVTFYSPETFLKPLDVFKVWQGGMSFHGGFLGVVAAGLYASWKFKIEKFRIGDMASIGAPIGLGLVRLANFVNQELWGRPTDVPWAVRFTKDADFLPRHPSQLYEAFLEGLVLFLILRVLMVKYKALTKPGIIFGALVFFYGLFRFSVEFAREPDTIEQLMLINPAESGYRLTFDIIPENLDNVILIFSRGMMYSLPMVIIGAFIILWANRRAPVSPKRIADEKDADLA